MKDVRNNKLFIFFWVLITFYVLFYFIFFFILGENSFEFIIAFCFSFLIFILYKEFSVHIYNYLWSLSKDIWLNLTNLLFVLKSINELIVNFNNIYLKFLHYKVYVLNSVSFSLNDIWFSINNNLLKKYFINNVLILFFDKLNIINKFNNKIINYQFINILNLNKVQMFNNYFILILFNKNK